jgi:hypothetical protein
MALVAYCVECRQIKTQATFYAIKGSTGVCKVCQNATLGSQLLPVSRQLCEQLVFVFNQIEEMKHGSGSR